MADDGPWALVTLFSLTDEKFTKNLNPQHPVVAIDDSVLSELLSTCIDGSHLWCIISRFKHIQVLLLESMNIFHL